jgi:hypothetical protein
MVVNMIVTLQENKLQVFENKVLRKMFEPKSNEFGGTLLFITSKFVINTPPVLLITFESK